MWSRAAVVALTFTSFSTLIALTHAQSNPFKSGQPDYPKSSAFTAVTWMDDKPLVEVNGQWYELVSFHGISTEEILAHSDREGWDTRRRFAEDLVQMVRLMGHKIDKTTDLVLRNEAGELVTLDDFEMTEANRSAVAKSTRSGLSIQFGHAAVLQDLREFESALEKQFSYLRTSDVDYRAAIRTIGGRSAGGMAATELARELQKVIALFIDGHARVSGGLSGLADGYLPVLIEASGDRFVALRPNRSEFLDAAHPYVDAIDGVAIDGWLGAISAYVPKGSPQYIRRRTLDLLPHIQHWRTELDKPRTNTVDVELVSRDGKTRRKVTIGVTKELPRPTRWPNTPQSGVLDGEIGYLRLETMGSDSAELIRQWMPRFAETIGLVVDVRRNGGGTREPILELAAHLMSADEPPRVATVAKYRLAKQFDEDHLGGSRFMFRADSPQFDDRERAAIRAFMKTFKPQWEPPADEFSDWHYLVLSKSGDDMRPLYKKPVVILLDEGCFSATDIFLGTFKGWPNLTLIGQPSSGGSARVESFRLPNSGTRVSCASMASFQPSGRLYDTNGVQPDVVVPLPPEYFLREEGQDHMLQAAVEHLRLKTSD